MTWESCRIGSCHRHQKCMYTPCRSSPDAQARLKAEYTPARFVEAQGSTIQAMHEHFETTDVYQAGDARLVWINEGDLYPDGLFAKRYTRTPDTQPSSTEGEVERVAFEIASSLWGKAQAETFFKLRERNAHFGLAVNAARAAIAAQVTKP